MIKTIITENAPAAIGPYAQAVEVNGCLYTSGQIALRPDGTFVEGDIHAQIAQVLSNLDAVLQAADVARNQIVKATIFVTDLKDFEAVNQAYGAFLGDHRPARSTVQVAALPRGARVEIELIAQRA